MAFTARFLGNRLSYNALLKKVITKRRTGCGGGLCVNSGKNYIFTTINALIFNKLLF